MAKLTEFEAATLTSEALESVAGGGTPGWLRWLSWSPPEIEGPLPVSITQIDVSNNGQQLVFIGGQNNQNSNAVGNQAVDSSF